MLTLRISIVFVQESTQGIYVIDPRSKLANDDYIRYYRFYGRLIAKAIYDRHVIDSPLALLSGRNDWENSKHRRCKRNR